MDKVLEKLEEFKLLFNKENRKDEVEQKISDIDTRIEGLQAQLTNLREPVSNLENQRNSIAHKIRDINNIKDDLTSKKENFRNEFKEGFWNMFVKVLGILFYGVALSMITYIFLILLKGIIPLIPLIFFGGSIVFIGIFFAIVFALFQFLKQEQDLKDIQSTRREYNQGKKKIKSLQKEKNALDLELQEEKGAIQSEEQNISSNITTLEKDKTMLQDILSLIETNQNATINELLENYFKKGETDTPTIEQDQRRILIPNNSEK